MSLFRPFKYITNVTENKGIQIMKITQIRGKFVRLLLLLGEKLLPWE